MYYRKTVQFCVFGLFQVGIDIFNADEILHLSTKITGARLPR